MTYTIVTDYPVAVDSPDHLHPFGTKNDNSHNEGFNRKLLAKIGPSGLKLLDLGCAGGRLVQDMITAGSEAVGIEGSDYSKKMLRPCWDSIPGMLFTADATKPFRICRDGHFIRFNVITMWEFLEHLTEEGLVGLFRNIEKHAMSDALLIGSVSLVPCNIDGVELHQTVKTADWSGSIRARRLLAGQGCGKIFRR